MSLLKALNLRPPAHGMAQAGAKRVEAAAASTEAQKSERLARAAVGWRLTHRQADERITALTRAIKSHYIDGHPDLLQEIDRGVSKLDAVLDNIDRRLADALASAAELTDNEARKTELQSAKALLTRYITYVKTEPLITHMDHNPFGVKTDLMVLLVGGLTEAAKAIG